MNPGTRFGRFEIGDRVAAGGMGEVYKAVQTAVGEFRKPLALKLLLPELADHADLVEMFLTEGRLAARLNHPNIVQVFDVGMLEERYYLAMELVEGLSLTALGARMKKAGLKPSSELVSHIARQALEGLHYAHTAMDDKGRPLELVHRDISMGNVLLSAAGDVKLADFGIAKARDRAQLTDPGVIRGKTAYMSPEMLFGSPATVRSDIYALGVTLYRLAAAESPYEDEVTSTTRAVVPLSTRRPDLSKEVLDAVARSLEPEAKDRFESAAQMRDAFPRGDFEQRRSELGALVRELAAKGPATRAAPAVRAETAAANAPMEPTVLNTEPRAPKQRGAGFLMMVMVATVAAVLAGAAGWKALHPVEVPASAPAPVPVAQVAPPAPAQPPEPAKPPEPEVPAAAPTAETEPEPAAASARPKHAARAPKTLEPPALLSVQAQPWALVEVDGKVVGQTPLGEVAVANPHPVIRLTNPSYAPFETRPHLKPGERFKLNRNLGPH
jgi:serine/threonine-protein kinase